VAHAQPGESVTADREAIRESPLVLGVLGHRELDPARVPRLRDAVVGFMAEIREHLPETELHATIGAAADADVSLVMLDLADDVDTADSVVHWTPGTGDAGTPSQPCLRMPPQLARQLVDLNTYNRDYRRLRAQGRNHILLELGRNSLMESYLWTIHRYHREHEPAGKH
jgi:hypothetical protein